LEGTKTPERPNGIQVLLTVVGENPVLLTADGRFAKMHDVKMDKDHYFNVDKIIHIQLEEERDV
jgi:hypothetical protein